MVNKLQYAAVAVCIAATAPAHAHEADIVQEYCNLARIYKEEGNADKARMYYQKALSLDPTNAQARMYMVSATGAQSSASTQTPVAQQPQAAPAAVDSRKIDEQFARANQLLRDHKVDQAIELYEDLRVSKPNNTSILYNLGIAYTTSGKTDKAISVFEKILDCDNQSDRAYFHLGSLYHKKKLYEQARGYLQRAHEIKPTNVEVIQELGDIYRETNQFEKAIEYYERALKIEPLSIFALLQLGNSLNMIDKPEQALPYYKKAVDTYPTHPQALYNYAYTLKRLEKVEEALPIYNKLLAFKPDYASAHFGRALSYLALENWELGWPEYEWRWAAYDETPPALGKPVWDGSNPAGKTILIYAEQGLGDTFQFIRYAKVLKDRGARVVAMVQKPLVQLLGLCEYIDQVVPRGGAYPQFDEYIAMMSLPMVCKTRLNTVPCQQPYLRADAKLVEYWREKLAHDTNFKIGICWQGNAGYQTESLRRVVAAKSMKVANFAPIARMEGVSLYNLQKGFGEEQLSELDASVKIHTFDKDFDEAHGRFMDTAAVMQHMDLIISIDTSTCHIAAALGRPTWVMLPNPADWRWMLNREDTPWYPTMRLFKQPTPGDWESVVQRITRELPAYIKQHTMRKKASDMPSTEQKIVAATQAALAAPVAQTSVKNDWVDRMILLGLQVERSSDPAVAVQLRDELVALHEQYEALVKKSPVCEGYAQELREVNEQLWVLNDQLKETQHTAFDQNFVRLARKIIHVHALKQAIVAKLMESVSKA